jgi:hypothetical protein
MYCIDITVHNVVTDKDSTTTLYNKSLHAAVTQAYELERAIGVDGFVSIQYQHTDTSGFVCLSRLDWPEYA